MVGKHARPTDDIDFNNVRGECGTIDPQVVEKQMNYIKVNHRSWDPLEFWTHYNFHATYDEAAAKDLIRLAELDIRHQYALHQRALRAGILSKEDFEKSSVATPSGAFPVHSKHSSELATEKWGYPEYKLARKRLEREFRVASGLATTQEQQEATDESKEDHKLGFPPLQPLIFGKYYMSSIDRWHVDVIDKEFCTRVYESLNKPVMILGLIEDAEKDKDSMASSSEEKTVVEKTPENAKYPAHFWTIDYLKTSKFKDCMFRLGDHDDGTVLRAKLKVFLQYLETNKDDSPLYLFEDSIQRCPVSKQILSLYRVPPHFAHDLLLASMPEDHIPPYNWLLIGPKRSGTRMHLDPRSTSAWNMSVTGRKRWVLFRPGIPLAIAKGHIVMTPEEEDLRRDRGNPQAIYFFTHLMPRLRRWIRGREKKREYRLRELAKARSAGNQAEVERILKEARVEQEDIEAACEAADEYFSAYEKHKAVASTPNEPHFWPEVTADPSFGMCIKDEKRGDGTWRRRRWNELEDGYGMMEFIQYPGETILVPSGWWHAVINIDDTIAYTQNFTNRENFVPVWRHMRRHNKSMARRWLYNLKRDRPDIARLAEEIDAKDGYKLSPFKKHPDSTSPEDGNETSDTNVSESESTDTDIDFEDTDDDE